MFSDVTAFTVLQLAEHDATLIHVVDSQCTITEARLHLTSVTFASQNWGIYMGSKIWAHLFFPTSVRNVHTNSC